MRSFTEFILSEAEGFRMTGQKLSDPSNKLVYYGVFADIVSARRRERQINEGSEVKLPDPSHS